MADKPLTENPWHRFPNPGDAFFAELAQHWNKRDPRIPYGFEDLRFQWLKALATPPYQPMPLQLHWTYSWPQGASAAWFDQYNLRVSPFLDETWEWSVRIRSRVVREGTGDSPFAVREAAEAALVQHYLSLQAIQALGDWEGDLEKAAASDREAWSMGESGTAHVRQLLRRIAPSLFPSSDPPP